MLDFIVGFVIVSATFQMAYWVESKTDSVFLSVTAGYTVAFGGTIIHLMLN